MYNSCVLDRVANFKAYTLFVAFSRSITSKKKTMCLHYLPKLDVWTVCLIIIAFQKVYLFAQGKSFIHKDLGAIKRSLF